MRVVICKQGSQAWLRVRMGRVTASEMERIIQPKKWEPTKSETRRNYMHYLLTELILDCPLAGVTTAAMQAGHEWEPRARAAYEMMMGVEVEECGFVMNDAGTVGASPDFLVAEDGSGEIKCPSKPEIHVGYMLDPQSLVAEHFVQTQGQLKITGRKWTDLISYFSGLPMVCVRVEPHPEFQAKLEAALAPFVADFALLVELAKDKGWIKERVPDGDDDGLTAFGLNAQEIEDHISHLRKEGVLTT